MPTIELGECQMFKRKRAKKAVRGVDENYEYKAIVASLSPHVSDKDHAKWWQKWQADQAKFEQSPFLRVVTFADEVCQAHGLDQKTRRQIRDSLCKSLLIDSNHTAA
jgi:hypothetical protein